MSGTRSGEYRDKPETLDGQSQGLGFLFLYLLFTQQLKVHVTWPHTITPLLS